MNPKVERQVRDVFALLREHSINLVASSPDGCNFISADDAIQLMTDPDAYWASRYQVPVEKFRPYRDFREEQPQQCTALTRNGARCRHWVLAAHLVTPKNFKPGYSDRCPAHGGPKANGQPGQVDRAQS
jgi:hypothetical protein